MVKSPEIDSITSPFEDDINTQLLQKLVIHNMETVDADGEMLGGWPNFFVLFIQLNTITQDMETQTWSQLAPDSIQSFENEQEPIEIDDSPVKAPPGPRKNEVMECDCGITVTLQLNHVSLCSPSPRRKMVHVCAKGIVAVGTTPGEHC